MTATKTKPTTKSEEPAPPALEFVKPHPDPNANILLYGPPKSGKTVGAASAPGPILYLNADRPNATRFAHGLRDDLFEIRVEGLETLIKTAGAIESHDFKTVVVDPVAEVYRIVLEAMSGRALHPKIQDYGDTGTHVERFCRMLCEHPINAVFVAHEIVVQNEESGGFETLPFVSTKSGSPVFAAKLMAMVDVIGYTGIVPGEGDQETRYMAQLINARGRRGGDRFGVLGDARELNLSEWIELARQSTTEKEQLNGTSTDGR